VNEDLKKKIEDILANTEEGKAAAAGKAFGARHVMWVTDEIMKIVDGQGLSRSRVAQVAAFEMLDTAFHLLKAIGTKHAEVTHVHRS
jgi:hypothetical protein